MDISTIKSVRILACLVVALHLCACTTVKLSPKQSEHASNKQESQELVTAPAAVSSQPTLQGDWRVGFQVNNVTHSAQMHLTQNGNSFHGSGKDDPSGAAFSIENGIIHGDQLTFDKRYPNSPPNAPIHYAGNLSNTNQEEYQGPYLSGDYSLTGAHGKIISGNWDAILDQPVKQTTNTKDQVSSKEPAKAYTEANPTKPPELSGKWEAGYEYKFTTVHSVMFLEQDGRKIVGHGIDSTKEKFEIKGSYEFPKLTLIRQYLTENPKGKGKSAGRTMVFKADVSVVNAPDYQGPYLHGKTDGGGGWEAQLVK